MLVCFLVQADTVNQDMSSCGRVLDGVISVTAKVIADRLKGHQAVFLQGRFVTRDKHDQNFLSQTRSSRHAGAGRRAAGGPPLSHLNLLYHV